MTQRPSAVAFFPGDHPQLATNVRAQLERKKANQVAHLVQATVDDLRFRQGVITGLDIALDLCEQAEKELTER